jgi:hypothetical protein
LSNLKKKSAWRRYCYWEHRVLACLKFCPNRMPTRRALGDVTASANNVCSPAHTVVMVPRDHGVGQREQKGGQCCVCGLRTLLVEGQRRKPPVIPCGCRCEGAQAHVLCCVRLAAKDPNCWWRCASCECPFQSEMELALLEEHWSQVKSLADENRTRLLVASALGACLVDHRRYFDAEVIQRELFVVRKRLHGEEHSYTLTAANSLASTLMLQQKHTDAEALQREVLAVMKRVHSADHPYSISTSAQLANTLSMQGKHAEAEQVKRELLAAKTRLNGHEHPDTLAAAQDLAMSLTEQGKHAEAEGMQREVLLLRKRMLGDDHPDTLFSATVLAGTLSLQGKLVDAEVPVRGEVRVAESCRGNLNVLQRSASHLRWRWWASGSLVLAVCILIMRSRPPSRELKLRFVTPSPSHWQTRT